MVPAVLSVMAGVTVNYFQRHRRSGFTLRWLGEVWRLYDGNHLRCRCDRARDARRHARGRRAGGLCATREAGRLTRAVEEILTLPVAVPGLATALALILVYGSYGDFRQSLLFILVGHVVFTLPFMVRTVMAVFAARRCVRSRKAPRTLGAGPWRASWRDRAAVQPGIAGRLAHGLHAVIGEFNLTWMLHTPLTRTLPVGLADSYASMRLEIGCAYTLFFFFMILPVLWLMQAAAVLTGAVAGGSIAGTR